MQIARRQQWALVAGAAGTLGWQLAERGLASGWRYALGEDPPDDPMAVDVQLGRALAWAVIVGAVAGAAQVLAQRGAASLWKEVAGRRPPQRRRRKVRRRHG